MRKFKLGEPYFMVRWEDAKRRYIAADTIVFIGENLQGESEERMAWYFQDAESYCAVGPLMTLDLETNDLLEDRPDKSLDHHWNIERDPHLYIVNEEDIESVMNRESYAEAILHSKLG